MKIKIEKFSDEELEQKGVFQWGIWTKEKSRFDWYYDSAEQCYFLEGKVIIKSEFETVEIGKGDFITFPNGLACIWDIIEPVKKHYHFD